MSRRAFRANLSEDAGLRSGFALTRQDLQHHLGTDHPTWRQFLEEPVVRLPATDYADTVGDLLFALGTVPEKGMPPLSSRIIRRFPMDWRTPVGLELLLSLEAVANHYVWLRSRRDNERHAILDELRAMADAIHQDLWPAVFQACEDSLAFNPFYNIETSLTDLVSLQDLFASEQQPSDPGQFIDQRFINYLSSHPEAIKRIHWRQFEQLTAEWFHRAGYEVELGPGRKDGGVDVRAWAKDPGRAGPPALIIQCKRISAAVDAFVVKALWADMINENADAAIVVTTSKLSDDAEETCSARCYPVTCATGDQVKDWVTAMRRPWTGFTDGLPD